jgi:iron(III) transport system permease protein
VLLALLMLMGAGVARLGYFRGDIFVAGAVVLCAALLLLFVALPVAKSLIGAFLDEAGSLLVPAWPNAWARTASGACPAWSAGVRCGVAWNTLFLALLTAAGTTVLGTLIALLAERGNKRLSQAR